MMKLFEGNPEMVETTDKVDEEFFAAGKPCFGCDQEFFLCDLGDGDPDAQHPRLSRLPFNAACSLL
jgi:hypothetical protein